MHIHLDAHMHFHKRIKPGQRRRPELRLADGDRRHDQLPHRGRRRRDRRPRAPGAVPARRHVGDGHHVGLCAPAWENLDVTTVTERQRCLRHCAHRAAPGGATSTAGGSGSGAAVTAVTVAAVGCAVGGWLRPRRPRRGRSHPRPSPPVLAGVGWTGQEGADDLVVRVTQHRCVSVRGLSACRAGGASGSEVQPPAIVVELPRLASRLPCTLLGLASVRCRACAVRCV